MLVLDVKDEEFNVPVLGKTQTKAIRYEMSVPDAGGKRIKTVSTGHLIAQDGTWHWTLSERSLSAFLAAPARAGAAADLARPFILNG